MLLPIVLHFIFFQKINNNHIHFNIYIIFCIFTQNETKIILFNKGLFKIDMAMQHLPYP